MAFDNSPIACLMEDDKRLLATFSKCDFRHKCANQVAHELARSWKETQTNNVCIKEILDSLCPFVADDKAFM